MITFTVEGHHWLKDVELDESLYEKYNDMTFEAMTQAIEGFFNGEYEEEYDGEPSLGLYMAAYQRGCGMDDDKRVIALTEFVLYNAGFHVVGQEFRQMAIAALQEENRKKKD